MISSEQPVYCIGGLGVDEKAFDHYHFPGEKIVMPYLLPQSGESIRAFALRMAENIRHERFTLIGVSLGGILAQEIAAHRSVESLVLISSIRSCTQIPWVYRRALRAGGNTALRLAWHMDVPAFRNYAFTVKHTGDKKFLQDIYENTDYDLVEWAIPRIMKWPGAILPDGIRVISIHGTSDKLFPVGKRSDIDSLIPVAGHFMVVSHQTQVISVINNFLTSD